MNDYTINDCYAEVYDILSHTNKELVTKIPKSFIEWLKLNKTPNYNVKINYSLGIENCILKRETSVLLTIIYNKYLKEEKNEIQSDIQLDLIETKEKWYSKILKKIRKLLKK